MEKVNVARSDFYGHKGTIVPSACACEGAIFFHRKLTPFMTSAARIHLEFFLCHRILKRMSYYDVLVLGAGASVRYGFPTGGELRELILHKFQVGGTEPTDSGPVPFPEILSHLKSKDSLPFTRKHCLEFHEAFLKSQRYSIDAFIEMRDKDFGEIGKWAIAHCLRVCESENRLFSAGDWYQVLFNYLLPRGSLEPKNFTVITFNYDRSLQHYLKTAMIHALGEKYREGLERSINFHCLHGSFHKETSVPSFGNAMESNDLAFAKTIKLPHEVSENGNRNVVLDNARRNLVDAKRIFILGFGFDETNTRRLFNGVDVSKAEIIASNMGLGKKAREFANASLGRTDSNSIFREESESIEEILREYL